MRLRRQDRGREGPSFLVPAWLAAASPLHSPRQGASRVPPRPPHRSPSSDGRAEAVDTLYDHRSRPASCPTVRDQKDWDSARSPRDRGGSVLCRGTYLWDGRPGRRGRQYCRPGSTVRPGAAAAAQPVGSPHGGSDLARSDKEPSGFTKRYLSGLTVTSGTTSVESTTRQSGKSTSRPRVRRFWPSTLLCTIRSKSRPR